MTEYDLTLMPEEFQLRDRVYAIETSSLSLERTKYESYILHAESLRSVWTKYESYILHTSADMYTFQTLNKAVNVKLWPDLDLDRKSNLVRVCAIERSYPKVGVSQIFKWYLEYFSSYIYFSKPKRKYGCK